MTPIRTNEKVVGLATMPAEATRTASLALAMDALRQFAHGLARAPARRAMADNLGRLDDRMLADIGIARQDIRRVAEDATGGPALGLLALLARLFRVLAVQPLRAWYRRRATMRELMRLDDRMLADIGIERGELALLGRIERPRNAAASEPAIILWERGGAAAGVFAARALGRDRQLPQAA